MGYFLPSLFKNIKKQWLLVVVALLAEELVASPASAEPLDANAVLSAAAVRLAAFPSEDPEHKFSTEPSRRSRPPVKPNPTHEEQARKDCLQESQRCWKESLQEKRFGQMDQSFHASTKEPRIEGIRCMQERNQILQGSHAPLQGISHVYCFVSCVFTSTTNCSLNI